MLHDIQTPIVAAYHSMKVTVVGDVFCSADWVQEAVARKVLCIWVVWRVVVEELTVAEVNVR